MLSMPFIFVALCDDEAGDEILEQALNDWISVI